jgi:autotransporter-associated beta strand protein
MQASISLSTPFNRHHRVSPFWAKTLLQFAILGCISSQANAATVVWDGGAGDDDWTNNLNWAGDTLPAIGDTVEFDGNFGTGSTALFLGGSHTVNSILISTSTDFLLLGSTLTISSGSLTRTATTGQTWITSKIALGTDSVWDIEGSMLSSGVVSGAVSVTKSGTGTLTLSGNNTYTGGTIINEGTLSIATNTRLGLSSSGLTFGGGTLAVTTGFTMNRPTSLNAGGGTIKVSSGQTLIQQAAISGTGNSLTKSDLGTLSLSAANTYTGGTNIEGGTLALLSGGSLADSGSVNLLGATSVFNIAGITTSETISKLTGVAGSKVQLGGSTLILEDSSSYSFAGDIEGSGGSVTKRGTGVITLSGNNTYSGTTNLEGGTLLLGSAGALSSSANVLLSGGNINASSFGGTTSGSLSLTANAVLNFGGGSSSLSFGNNTTGTWSGTLSVWNWSGGIWSNGSGTLNFGASTLTPSQLLAIQFYSDSGVTKIGEGADFLSGSSGNLVPVPEPTALVCGLLLVGVACGQRRKLNQSTVSPV